MGFDIFMSLVASSGPRLLANTHHLILEKKYAIQEKTCAQYSSDIFPFHLNEI